MLGREAEAEPQSLAHTDIVSGLEAGASLHSHGHRGQGTAGYFHGAHGQTIGQFGRLKKQM